MTQTITGKRIRELREKQTRGVTQATLARAVGVQPLAISRLERGEAKTPRTGTLSRLSEFFGVTTDYLLGRTDSPHDHSRADTPEWSVAAWQVHRRDTKVIQQVRQLAYRTKMQTSAWFQLEALLNELAPWSDVDWQRIWTEKIDEMVIVGARKSSTKKKEKAG